jgi:hypothetical protein
MIGSAMEASREYVRAMTETPVEAFLRVRKRRGDKFSYLAALLGLKGGGSVSASLSYKRLPECWLSRLPEEYVQPIIIAMVRQHVKEIDRLWSLAAVRATEKPADGGKRHPAGLPSPVPIELI